MLLHLLFSVALIASASAGSPSRLAVIEQAPEFTLTDQNGSSVHMTDLRGRVLLVSFIFTTCNGTCPATTHRLGEVQQELKRRGVCREDQVRLLSITLDPARDTAEALQNYAHLYDADLSTWSFLTGSPDEVHKVIGEWGMWAKPSANGQLDHPSRIFLVDKRGRIREIYHLGFLRPQWTADDVELLLKERD